MFGESNIGMFIGTLHKPYTSVFLPYPHCLLEGCLIFSACINECSNKHVFELQDAIHACAVLFIFDNFTPYKAQRNIFSRISYYLLTTCKY